MALKYTLDLPESPAKDLGARELHVTKGSNPEEVINLPGDAKSAELLAERNTAISLFLVDVDTSGNRSVPGATLAFTAVDTIPPAQPGAPVVSSVVEAD